MALSPFGQRAVDTTIRSIPEIVERLEAAHRLSPYRERSSSTTTRHGRRSTASAPWMVGRGSRSGSII